MRTARILTNLRCNQACTYCDQRSPTDDPAFIQAAAVRARIDQAIEDGAKDLVFSGGEPGLRRDLVELIAHASGRLRGEGRVILETNATTVDASRALELAKAGLGLARVNLSGWGEDLDQVTRDPGGFDRTLAGLQALALAKIPIELSVVILRATLPLLAELPRRVVAVVPSGLQAIQVDVPIEGPDASELLLYDEAAQAILALDRAARPYGLPVHRSESSALLPCIFEPRHAPKHFFAMTPGGGQREGHRQIGPCKDCLIADRCDGFHSAYLARDPSPKIWPVLQDKRRRQLTLISDLDSQIDRELVSPNLHKAADGSNEYEEVIRINFRCNQACRFCFVSTHLPAASDAKIEAAIRQAAEKGARITLSGGEPTLNPRLRDFIKLARSLSDKDILLQTNAVDLADPALTRSIVEAGLSRAFVSLHGSQASISDDITGVPGSFEKTLLGIDNLYACGVTLCLNFVICGRNYQDLPAWVGLTGRRWPAASLNISFVAPSTDLVPRDGDMVPRYSQVMPSVEEAIHQAERLGVVIGGFESMCGVPLCLVPTELDRYFKFSELPPDFDQGEFEKPPACDHCELRNKCWGLRSGYQALHGFEELRPVHQDAHSQGA